MKLEITKTSESSRPAVTMPDKAILKHLGEDGVRKLVSDHYDLLATSSIKGLFPESPIGLERAKKHSADFFIQILGGPTYFNDSRGNPMLVRRHIPFEITAEARIVWMECYREALLKTDISEELMLSYWQYLDVFSFWMINK